MGFLYQGVRNVEGYLASFGQSTPEPSPQGNGWRVKRGGRKGSRKRREEKKRDGRFLHPGEEQRQKSFLTIWDLI